MAWGWVVCIVGSGWVGGDVIHALFGTEAKSFLGGIGRVGAAGRSTGQQGRPTANLHHGVQSVLPPGWVRNIAHPWQGARSHGFNGSNRVFFWVTTC